MGEGGEGVLIPVQTPVAGGGVWGRWSRQDTRVDSQALGSWTRPLAQLGRFQLPAGKTGRSPS